LRIIVLGSGSIIPTKERFGSSILLETRRLGRVMLDIGPGALEKLRKLNVDPRSIRMLLITHFHVDHVSDLPALIKLKKFLGGDTLHIIGPRGLAEFIEDLILKNRFFSYLVDLECLKYIELHECWDGVAIEGEGYRIISKPVEHFGGVAYRIEDEDLSLVYSGDTKPDERLIDLSRNIDVLIHECSFPSSVLLGKHTSDEDLVKIVARVKPRVLVVVHLYPEMELRRYELMKALRNAFDGDIFIPKDLDIIEV